MINVTHTTPPPYRINKYILCIMMTFAIIMFKSACYKQSSLQCIMWNNYKINIRNSHTQRKRTIGSEIKSKMISTCSLSLQNNL